MPPPAWPIGAGVALQVVLLTVVMAFLLGRSLLNAALALCVVYIPQYFRMVRNQTAGTKAELYVTAARSLAPGRCGSCAVICCAT